MEFDMNKSLQILERTPLVVEILLRGLDEDWTHHNEGGETWSAYDVTGHFVVAEKTNWIPRIKAIVDDIPVHRFPPFNRFGQFEGSKGKSLDDLIEEFKSLRKQNILQLKNILTDETLLDLTGVHPEFGEVTLRQLLSTWVVHDFTHLSQIIRVMAKQYKDAVGPWAAYLSVVK
jgi:hypothetical protein